MPKKAIIFDLDNTIYAVQSIGEALFHPLFKLILHDSQHLPDIDKIKADIMRRPFLHVARDFRFSKELIEQATHHLQHHVCLYPLDPYPDYHFTTQLNLDKFLVTTGFQKLQQSKIDRLNIAGDFKEIHIVDPSTSSGTKKDVFAEIMQRHRFHHTEVLVVGDDLYSEIKAAKELGMSAILYDHENVHQNMPGIDRINSMSDLQHFIDK